MHTIEYRGKTYAAEGSRFELLRDVVLLAKQAIQAGTKPKNYRWFREGGDFYWLTQDNELVPMDAYDVVALHACATRAKVDRLYRDRLREDAMVA